MMTTRSNMIKNVRLNLLLDRDAFAKLIKVSKSSISFYENGLRTPRMPTLKKIKELADKNGFQFDIDDFFNKGNE